MTVRKISHGTPTMILMLAGAFWAILFYGTLVHAQEPPDSQCQSLAAKFGKNPDALSMNELERLRFCVNQTLEHRQKNLQDGLLKGTIIEPPTSSDSSPGTEPPPPPSGLKVQ